MIPDRHTTTLVGGSVIEQSRTDGPGIVPHRPSRASIEGEDIIRGGQVHNPANHHRCSLEPLGVAGMENPGGAQLGGVSLGYLFQTAEAASGVVPVVGSPVLRDWARQ